MAKIYINAATKKSKLMDSFIESVAANYGKGMVWCMGKGFHLQKEQDEELWQMRKRSHLLLRRYALCDTMGVNNG